jgi:hypothetical protein
MAHILLPSSELPKFQALTSYLPNGTTLIEQDKKGNCLKRYVVDHDQLELKLDKDFVEDAKDFTPAALKKFTKTLTKAKVVDFFLLGHEVDDHPYREYSACSNKLHELFKYLNNTGYQILKEDEDTYETIGTYQVRIERGADLVVAKKEIQYLMGRVKKKRPDLAEYTMSIMEESLSVGGCYSLVLNLLDKKAKITCTSYGRTSEVNDWDSLSNALAFIQKRLPATTY